MPIYTQTETLITDIADGQLNIPYPTNDIENAKILHEKCMKFIKSEEKLAKYIDLAITEELLSFSTPKLLGYTEEVISNTPLFSQEALSEQFQFNLLVTTTSVSNAAYDIWKHEVNGQLKEIQKSALFDNQKAKKVNHCFLVDLRMGAIGQQSLVLQMNSQVNKRISEKAQHNLNRVIKKSSDAYLVDQEKVSKQKKGGGRHA